MNGIGKLENEKKLDSVEEKEVRDFAKEKFLEDFGINKDGILDSIIERIETGKGPEQNALPTGFKALNGVLDGGGVSGLTVLGGTPGSGKTSLGVQLGLDIAERNDVPFILYSLEMSRKRLIERMLCTLSGLSKRELYGRIIEDPDGRPIRTFAEGDLEKFKEGCEKLRKLSDRIFIIDGKDEKTGWVIERLDSETIERLQEVENAPKNLWRFTIEEQIEKIIKACDADTAFVVVDHLQIFPLMEYELDRDGNFRQNLKILQDERARLIALMQKFNNMRNRQNIALLLISQLNRQAYKDPSLSAYMGSASIEYLVDVGLALVDPRLEETENKDKKGRRGLDLSKRMQEEQEESPKPIDVHLKVLKNRDGITGYIPMKFHPKIFKFWVD